jgi:predicted Zn-dependent peptidase
MTAPLVPRALLAASVAVEVVGADPDARLFQEVRERMGLGYELGLGVEHGRDWAVVVLSASAARADAERLRDAIDRTFTRAAEGFTRAELARARKKIRYRFARLADSRMDRAIAHASREAAGHPTLAASQQAMDALAGGEVEHAWRSLMRAPTLTAVLSG